MSNPDPSGDVPAPIEPVPPVPAPIPPSPHSPLNPAVLSNMSLLGGYILGAICLTGAIILAVIHDGSYTQAAFELFRDVLLFVTAGGTATGVAHVLVRRNQP